MLIRTNEKTLVRDPVSHSLINNDVEAFRNYKLQREQRQQITTMLKEIELLKIEIDALKKQTQQLIEKS